MSAREHEVLVKWSQRESKNLVAQRIGVTVRTINTYLDKVRIKYANVGRPALTKAVLVARAPRTVSSRQATCDPPGQMGVG